KQTEKARKTAAQESIRESESGAKQRKKSKRSIDASDVSDNARRSNHYRWLQNKVRSGIWITSIHKFGRFHNNLHLEQGRETEDVKRASPRIKPLKLTNRLAHKAGAGAVIQTRIHSSPVVQGALMDLQIPTDKSKQAMQRSGQ